jgi:GT2 family glycosyltransferase
LNLGIGMGAGRLAVVVVNWNGSDMLADCLQSLRNQTLPRLKVVVVDNGSTDGSQKMVREQFQEMTLLALDHNLGFAGGNNRGIASCDTEFIALLNNDAIADPLWAECLLAGASAPDVGIAASRVLIAAEPKYLDSAGDCMTVIGAPYKRGHRDLSDKYGSQTQVFGASGCAMLLRRKMLEEIGGFDEDFFLIYEDSDLCFRARLRGWRCVFVPEAIVYHKLNSSIGTLSRVHVYYGQRNFEFVYLKNMPSPLFWKYLPLRVLNLALACLYFAWRGQLMSFLKGKGDALSCLRRMLTKRRAIQAKRTVSVKELDSLLDRNWLRPRLTGKWEGLS